MEIKVIKITEEVANLIRGESYENGKLFNPILDADNNWILSLNEGKFLNHSFEVIISKPTII